MVDADQGLVTVRLQAVEGFFIEGFEVALRFETGDNDVIASTLWSAFVQSLSGEPQLSTYYESVFEQPVPAGEIIVLATANIGIGPGPEIPDPEGELRCRLAVEVPPGGRVDVEVQFSGDGDCLRRL